MTSITSTLMLSHFCSYVGEIGDRAGATLQPAVGGVAQKRRQPVDEAPQVVGSSNSLAASE